MTSSNVAKQLTLVPVLLTNVTTQLLSRRNMSMTLIQVPRPLNISVPQSLDYIVWSSALRTSGTEKSGSRALDMAVGCLHSSTLTRQGLGNMWSGDV